MRYKELRNLIVKGLHEYLKIPVVPSDVSVKKPPYPYVTYKFITKHRSQGSYNIIHATVPSISTDFEEDVEVTRQEQPKAVISISAYSLDGVEATEIAESIKDWFEFEGRQYLKDNNIVTVDTTDVKDRTILIVDNYEQRQGFDVTVRFSTERKMTIEGLEDGAIGLEVPSSESGSSEDNPGNNGEDPGSGQDDKYKDQYDFNAQIKKERR